MDPGASTALQPLSEDPDHVERQAHSMLGQLGVTSGPNEAGDVPLAALREALMRQVPSEHPGLAEDVVVESEAHAVLRALREQLLDDRRAPSQPWLDRWGLSHAAADALAAPRWPRDDELARRVAELWQKACAGDCDEWELGGTELVVALVVLLDRGSRLLRAGKREAFAADVGALTLAQVREEVYSVSFSL